MRSRIPLLLDSIPARIQSRSGPRQRETHFSVKIEKKKEGTMSSAREKKDVLIILTHAEWIELKEASLRQLAKRAPDNRAALAALTKVVDPKEIKE